ncbi:hypothetical protein D3C71_1668660 [compost metagenome]
MWISAASRAISMSCSILRWPFGSGRSAGVWAMRSRAVAVSPRVLLTTRATGCGCAAGDCARSAICATPASACGDGPDWLSRGRVLLSCSPPPWLLAWARKSACLGVSAVWVWVRITSRVGTTGAARSRV